VTETPYTPLGGAAAMIRSHAPIVVIDGPADTGKTRGVLEKIDWCARKYPRSRYLLFRKTRSSMSESVLVTFERKVLPDGSFVARGPDRAHRERYTYPNGSEIVVGGMDRAEKVLSAEYDIVAGFQGEELSLHDFETVTTRLRNGVMPYQQAIIDCNPGPPTHWIKGMWESGKAQRCPSRHADNPTFGPARQAILDTLTGVRRLRLRDGIWAAAEGTIYESFDAATHVVNPFPIPPEWLRYRAIDFGYVHPFVCLWAAVDPDGRIYVYRQIYRTRRLVEDHAQDIVRLSEHERISVTVTDHDAEDRATLDRHGVESTPAMKDVATGIQAVQERLRKQGDGKPRLFFFSDSLVERDPELASRHAPTDTVSEFDVYAWKQSRDRLKDEPAKAALARAASQATDPSVRAYAEDKLRQLQ
jgi:phage terminase large subunit